MAAYTNVLRLSRWAGVTSAIYAVNIYALRGTSSARVTALQAPTGGPSGRHAISASSLCARGRLLAEALLAGMFHAYRHSQQSNRLSERHHPPYLPA